jgi:hypothetical protein
VFPIFREGKRVFYIAIIMNEEHVGKNSAGIEIVCDEGSKM